MVYVSIYKLDYSKLILRKSSDYKFDYNLDQLRKFKMQKRLLRTSEAAEYLSVGRSTICEWLRQGKVPSLKLGKSRLFDIKELDEFVESLKANRQN